MDPKRKTQSSLEKARNILTDINGAEYRVPHEETDQEATNATPGGKEAKSGKKNVAIHYIDEIGWNPKTETFFAHFRIGSRTHTKNTKTKTLEGAKTWLLNHKVSLTNHANSGIIPGLTVEQGVDLWAKTAPYDKTRKKRPSLARVEDLKKKLEYHVLKFHGDKRIDSLDENFLLDEVARYENSSGPAGLHNIGGVRCFTIDLCTPFRTMLRKGWVAKIPTLPSIPDIGTPVIHFIPPDRMLDVLELFDRYVRYDVYAMLYVRVMGFSGLRTENARDLRKEYFDLDQGTFDTGITKNGKNYTFPIPEELKDLLKRLPGMDCPGLLFPGRQGTEKRQYQWCLKLFKRACKTLGIKTARAWHTMRASYATSLLRSGADVVLVQKAMTHETLTMILRYAATENSDMEQAQARNSEYLHEAREARRKRSSAR